MSVRVATGFGIVVGIGIGAIAQGLIQAETNLRTTAQTWAWWIVVLTTLLPLTNYSEEKAVVKGESGGFINDLGTGLGFFLLLAGKAP